MRRIPGGPRTVWIAVAVIVLVGIAVALHPGASRKHAAAEAPAPVGVAKATTGDIPIYLNALGTVTPLATVTVRSQVSGELASIDFTEGETVNAGAVLVHVDPRPFQAALDQARGQLVRDQAQLANARVDLDRYKTLLTQESVSQQQYATQASLVLQDEGIVKTDQAAVETAAINLDYTKVVSPVTGRVGLRQVDVGNLTQAQTTTIVVVTQIQPISVLFAVPEDSIGDITARLNQGATLEATAFDRARTKQIASGHLETLDNEIDVTTGTVKLRAMFDNTDGALFPNQFVNIQLLVDTAHNQIIVPTAAIQRGATGTFVFIVNDDNTVKMTTVKLGPADGENQGIADGIKDGETVVVDGADRLHDGSHVELPNANGNGQQDGAQPQNGKPTQQHGAQSGQGRNGGQRSGGN